MKILVLEDDYALAEVIKEILMLEGYDVDIANNADETYELTYNNKYDLYIFDINLPDENGLEVLKNLRKATDNTPTIYISALTDLSTISAAFKIGASDYLKKPFEPEELLIRIEAKFSSKEIDLGDFIYDPTANILYTKDKKIISLGNVQKKILKALSQNLNTITSKDELLDVLNADNDASLRVHINKLKKLGLNIKNIRGEGYILEV